jgi:hypothetical protein
VIVGTVTTQHASLVSPTTTRSPHFFLLPSSSRCSLIPSRFISHPPAVAQFLASGPMYSLPTPPSHSLTGTTYPFPSSETTFIFPRTTTKRRGSVPHRQPTQSFRLGVGWCTGARDGRGRADLRGKLGAAEDRQRWSLEEGRVERRSR